jgi:hypothetical protein
MYLIKQLIRNEWFTAKSAEGTEMNTFGFIEFIEFVGLKNKVKTIEVCLSLNFGRKPEFQRFVYDNKRKISA